MPNAKSPVSPTLAERFVALFHLPYWLGCAVVAFVILGLPFQIIVSYLGSFNLAQAVTYALPSTPTQAVEMVLVELLYFYVLFGPHYMRGRLTQEETSISSLLSSREEGFHELFGIISTIPLQIAIWIVFMVALLANSYVPISLSVSYIYVIFISAVDGLGSSSMLWTYLCSLRGVHKIGSMSLTLHPYYEDKTLGLRQIGNLALSLALTYFSGLALGFSLAILYDLSVFVIYPIFSVFIVLGILMFFLPLGRLHDLMKKYKAVEISKLAPKLAQIYANPDDSPIDLTQALLIEARERKVSAISTWPFDLEVLSKLIAIVISVMALIIGRLIIVYLVPSLR